MNSNSLQPALNEPGKDKPLPRGLTSPGKFYFHLCMNCVDLSQSQCQERCPNISFWDAHMCWVRVLQFMGSLWVQMGCAAPSSFRMWWLHFVLLPWGYTTSDTHPATSATAEAGTCTSTEIARLNFLTSHCGWSKSPNPFLTWDGCFIVPFISLRTSPSLHLHRANSTSVFNPPNSLLEILQICQIPVTPAQCFLWTKEPQNGSNFSPHWLKQQMALLDTQPMFVTGAAQTLCAKEEKHAKPSVPVSSWDASLLSWQLPFSRPARGRTDLNAPDRPSATSSCIYGWHYSANICSSSLRTRHSPSKDSSISYKGALFTFSAILCTVRGKTITSLQSHTKFPSAGIHISPTATL